MALYNEILAGRFNKFVTKLFSMKGAAAAPQLASEITIGLPLFNGIENRFLETWALFGVSVPQVATAAVNNNVQIRNPANSGAIVVVEAIAMIGGAAASTRIDMQYGQPTVDIGPVIAPRARDGRVSTTFGGGVAKVSFAQTAATQIGTTIWSVQVPTGNCFVFPSGNEEQETVLSPGDAICMQDQTQNNATCISFFWRERGLEESERK